MAPSDCVQFHKKTEHHTHICIAPPTHNIGALMIRIGFRGILYP